ncbi:MAG TPA: maltose alpha-D-glucosyltransferase [Longimicrobiales bacterium]|nr:maltose alpha-D-glucosyltransferase [Longimicrobiales bacterium]
MASRHLHPDNDPLWYKDAIIYELHVRTFADSNGDGTGDFPGLTSRLDYLADLGVTALWLLPFYPSPWKDDGYDIAGYTDIHPIYGTLSDFRHFLREAHARGIRVITELVINHTSDQHPWFQRARRARRGSPWRDFYVWSDSPDRYRDARIIFQDFESSNWAWDPVAGQYYWHRFYRQQPDLNFDNPRVHRAVQRAMDFWFRMGVDGMRLDAVPYLYEREGTNCENLPETHQFLKELRRNVDERFPNRMLLAEANQWPEDAVAYMGNGDECHMAFHFPVMPRLFMAIWMEDRFPIVDILEQTPTIPDNCQWAIFLRNHDELTLEMVTDEERDYMYRVYAQEPQMRINLGIRRRLAPLLGNSRRKIELMNGLLFSLPGTPVLYYGDEIGMGDNVFLGDRNGVRTPMQWSSDRNAGFSTANPQRLFLPVIIDPVYHYETINVEAQQDNPSSLLWWMKRLIAMRKRFRAFGRGTLEFLHPDNRKVLAFIRRHEEERILCVFNLSRFAQPVSLDLQEYRGLVPIELFGRTAFPQVRDEPYFLTLAPHTFLWFALPAADSAALEVAPAAHRAVVAVTGGWDAAFKPPAKQRLEELFPAYLRPQRWFAGKGRKVRSTTIEDTIRVPAGDADTHLLLVAVEYMEGDAEHYLVPIAYLEGERAERLVESEPHAVLARVAVDGETETGVLCDALVETSMASALLAAITGRRRLRAGTGDVVGMPIREFRRWPVQGNGRLEPHVLSGDHSHSAIVYGDQLFLKVFRKLDEGVSPDLEIGRFLTETGFEHTPAVAGHIEYRRGTSHVTLAVLKRFVPNEGNAWSYTQDALGRYFEHVLAVGGDPPEVRSSVSALIEQAQAGPSDQARDLVGGYLETARLLGIRTAEMHLALAKDPENPDFAPEPFTVLYQRGLYQSMRNLTGRVLQAVEDRLDRLPPQVKPDARRIIGCRGELLRQFRAIVNVGKITADRIRCHGDYHLGQVLYTGRDLVIIDFEGEPSRPLGERRLKRSALYDVAGMIRSFHYAANVALLDREQRLIRSMDVSALEPWARYWYDAVSAQMINGYLEGIGESTIAPASGHEFTTLLTVHLLEKAVYELGYELNHRPEWLMIPVRGILQSIEA